MPSPARASTLAARRRRRRRRLRVVSRRLAVLALLVGLVWAGAAGYSRWAPPDVPPVPMAESSSNTLGSRHPASQIRAVVLHQRCRRRVREVILHHSYRPTAAQYRGPSTIAGILSYHRDERHWGGLAYHYLVDPQGGIWLGRPLGERGTHTSGQNDDSVGVCLILDGDREVPSHAQQAACAALLRALFERFHLSARSNFDSGHGFHRDYAAKSCPGRRITKTMVLGWLKD